MHYFACPSCERHIHDEETSCPFCGVELVAPPLARPAPRGHLGRAALLAFGAALVSVACGEDTTDTTSTSSRAASNASSVTTTTNTTTGGGEGGTGGRGEGGGVGGGGGSAGFGGGIAPPYGHAPLRDIA
ncbi:MAG TPA: hypothetical protein VFB62_07260 [Polyangiaceae bacterium]|nr:hypothetical protein [Polyangiaceae bacterium]